jgi:hypothetical protein
MGVRKTMQNLSTYFVCQLRFENGVCEMKMRSLRARASKLFMAKGHTA